MHRRLFVLLTLLAMVANLTFAEQDRPNIVWVVSEDNSVHYLKLYDEGGTEMPTIERLAKNGLQQRLFKRAGLLLRTQHDYFRLLWSTCLCALPPAVHQGADSGRPADVPMVPEASGLLHDQQQQGGLQLH